MALHPPASAASIRKFFASDIGLGFPKSYGEFLGASDGVEWMWGGLHLMPTDPKRQKWVINEAVDQQNRFEARFCRIAGDPTDQNIRQWRNKGLVYLPMSTIAGISPVGDMLLYDHFSQQRDGEMAIGWKPPTTSKVEEWHSNIHAWLEACLDRARQEPAPSAAQMPTVLANPKPKSSAKNAVGRRSKR